MEQPPLTIRKIDVWSDLAKVSFFLLRLTLMVVLPVFFVLLCALAFVVAPTPFFKTLDCVIGILFLIRLRTLIRLGKTFHHVEKLLKAQTPPVSVPIPIAELGPYFESASEMPRGWWAEEAILIRVAVVELKQKRWSKPPTQLKIGLPVIGGLSEEEARCLMTYKMARRTHFASGVDRILERLNEFARPRMQPPGKKPTEIIAAVTIWTLLARHTNRAWLRNQKIAKDLTSARWGTELQERTFEKLSKIQKVWPNFENSTMAPLLAMGGIPPVAESFASWLSTGSPTASPKRQLRPYEVALYKRLTGARELKSLDLEDPFNQLGPSLWERQSRSFRAAVPGKHLRHLPELLDDALFLFHLVAAPTDAKLPDAAKTQKFIEQVHSACLAALSTAGWRWQVPPFQPIFLTRNGVQVCPHLWIESLLNKSMSAISFQGMLEEQGLDKIELTDVGEIKQLLM